MTARRGTGDRRRAAGGRARAQARELNAAKKATSTQPLRGGPRRCEAAASLDEPLPVRDRGSAAAKPGAARARDRAEAAGARSSREGVRRRGARRGSRGDARGHRRARPRRSSHRAARSVDPAASVRCDGRRPRRGEGVDRAPRRHARARLRPGAWRSAVHASRRRPSSSRQASAGGGGAWSALARRAPREARGPGARRRDRGDASLGPRGPCRASRTWAPHRVRLPPRRA